MLFNSSQIYKIFQKQASELLYNYYNKTNIILELNGMVFSAFSLGPKTLPLYSNLFLFSEK